MAKKQAKSILDNLSFIYYKTKNLIIELEVELNDVIKKIKNSYHIYDYKTFWKSCLWTVWRKKLYLTVGGNTINEVQKMECKIWINKLFKML